MKWIMEAATLKHDALLRIRQYGLEARALQHAQVHDSCSADNRHAADLDHRLEQTLKMVQEQVDKQRSDLEKLRSTLPSNVSIPRQPSRHPREQLQQLQRIRNAYERLTPASPNAVVLQPANTTFPALLALRTVKQTITNTRKAIQRTRKEVAYAEDELIRERALHQHAQELGTALKARITRINKTIGDRHTSNGSNEKEECERVRINLFAILDLRETRCVAIRQEIQYIKKAIKMFIWNRLPHILLAEKLRGPIVEQEPVIRVEDEGGTTGGYEGGDKLFAARQPRKQDDSESKESQNRIGVTWDREGDNNDISDYKSTSREEQIASEMEQLIGNLVETLCSGNTNLFVTLSRDSPQARYLVNARVAEYNPEDATQLRLVDFGQPMEK